MKVWLTKQCKLNEVKQDERGDAVSLQQDAEAIRQMQETEGWQLVSNYIEAKLIDHKGQLLHCSLEEVMKHRHMITAYNSINIHLNEITTESLA